MVYDEHHLDADTLQQGTLAASYLFQRATKAVSLIPVAYYADLACERARYYLNDFLNQGDQTKNLPGSYEQRDQKRQRVYETASAKWGEGVHRDIKDSMFYL